MERTPSLLHGYFPFPTYAAWAGSPYSARRAFDGRPGAYGFLGRTTASGALRAWP